MTISAIRERRYERLLLRDVQPRSQSWDGRWVFELTPENGGTRLEITEYGWTDGAAFFVAQRILSTPDVFLKYYAQSMGRALDDEPEIRTVKAH
jgi:hypothetical protein